MLSESPADLYEEVHGRMFGEVSGAGDPGNTRQAETAEEGRLERTVGMVEGRMKYPEWMQPRAPSLAKLAWGGNKLALTLLAHSGGVACSARLSGAEKSAVAARVAAQMTSEQRHERARKAGLAGGAKRRAGNVPADICTWRTR